MADTTPVLALPFPEPGDAPDVAGDIQALADKIEDVLTPTGLAAGQGLVWDGSGLVPTDLDAFDAGGLTIGTDVNLYRSAANVLKTDDSLIVGVDLQVMGDLTLDDDVTLAGGSVLTWAGDTNLYRDIANRLKTDDELVAGGGLVSESTAPFIRMADTDASVNEKMFNWVMGSATLRGRVLNDDFTTKAEAIMFDMVTGKTTVQQELEVEGALNHDGSTVGFYGAAPIAKPTITGSRGGNAALADLLTDLASMGLITNSTTA